jgi:hypothetical protein
VLLFKPEEQEKVFSTADAKAAEARICNASYSVIRAYLGLYDERQQVCVVCCVHDGVKAALQDGHGRTHRHLNLQQQQQQRNVQQLVMKVPETVQE